MTTNERMRKATRETVERFAYLTARHGTGQRKRDAIRHCEALGLNPNAATLDEARGK